MWEVGAGCPRTPSEPSDSEWTAVEKRSIPNPGSVTSEPELLAAITALRRQRGEPSLREIERSAREKGINLPRSTVGDILNGRFPTRERLFHLLIALGELPRNLPAWEMAWQRVKMGS